MTVLYAMTELPSQQNRGLLFAKRVEQTRTDNKSTADPAHGEHTDQIKEVAQGHAFVSSKERDPDPNKNSLVRKQCCKRRMEALRCRWFLSYQGAVLRVRVPLFASDLAHSAFSSGASRGIVVYVNKVCYSLL